MDYSLAALKLLCVQLKDVRGTASQSALTLGGILFQRAWLQGIIVYNDGDGRLLLDDGTGVIQLSLSGEFRLRRWDLGMYAMVVGVYSVSTGEIPMIKVHKIVDLSLSPDREAMWYLEVMEAYKMFYKPLIEDFMPTARVWEDIAFCVDWCTLIKLHRAFAAVTHQTTSGSCIKQYKKQAAFGYRGISIGTISPNTQCTL